MTIEQRKRLEGFKHQLMVYDQYKSIMPTNETIKQLRELYHDIGHPPTGNCGGCVHMIIETLIDHLKEEGLYAT
jgi:dGTP triphosphohydrolase